MSTDTISKTAPPIKALPSVERLRELLAYDPETGVFRWKVARNGTEGIGSVAGALNGSGYRQITIDGTKYLASRLAWKVATGVDPANTIDHQNHEIDDNRICNLREATQQEQARHRRSWGQSGYCGVYWDKRGRKWRAQISINRKLVSLGSFTCEKEAARAYDASAAKHHGEFANLNFPGDS